MTSVKWLIAVDMANALMGNVFVPEDTQDQPASKVSMNEKKTITDCPLGIQPRAAGRRARSSARACTLSWLQAKRSKKPLMRFDKFFL